MPTGNAISVRPMKDIRAADVWLYKMALYSGIEFTPFGQCQIKKEKVSSRVVNVVGYLYLWKVVGKSRRRGNTI